ncbi:MAG: hypothetical protein ACRDJH_17490 [Thermomicrobiales bacterium]
MSNATIWIMIFVAVISVLLATRPARPSRARRDRRSGEREGGDDPGASPTTVLTADPSQ